MSVITGSPPPDDGGEGGGLRAAGPKPEVQSITVKYPDEWTIEQVEAAQKRIYKALSRACHGGSDD